MRETAPLITPFRVSTSARCPTRDVVDQSLRNFELSLEVCWVGNPGQFVPRGNLLANLGIHELEDPLHPGPNLEPVDLVLAECEERFPSARCEPAAPPTGLPRTAGGRPREPVPVQIASGAVPWPRVIS